MYTPQLEKTQHGPVCKDASLLLKPFFCRGTLLGLCTSFGGFFAAKAAFTAKKFEPIYINMKVTSRHGETTVSLIFPDGYCRKNTRKGVKVMVEQMVLVNFSSAKQQELNKKISSLHLNSQRVTFSHGTRMNPLTFPYSLTLQAFHIKAFILCFSYFSLDSFEASYRS